VASSLFLEAFPSFPFSVSASSPLPRLLSSFYVLIMLSSFSSHLAPFPLLHPMQLLLPSPFPSMREVLI